MEPQSRPEPQGGRTSARRPDVADARRRALELLARRATGVVSPPIDGGVPPGPRARRVLAGLVVVVLLAGAPWWWQLRRPPPAEDSLPRADLTSTTATPSAGASGGSPPSTAAGPAGQVVVHVVGAVVRPGVLRLPVGARAVDAVDAAGGLAPDADVARVNLAAPLGDGQRLVVPVVGQEPPQEVAPAASSGGTASGGAPETGTPLDLNSATESQLDELPGVGPATAAAIVAHRESVGPFTSVDDLLDVRGIGPSRLEALRDAVRVG